MSAKHYHLRRWQTAIEQSEAELDAIATALGLAPESPICTMVHNLQNALTDATAKLVEDPEKWLEWFWHENNMGRKNMGVGTAEGVCTIKTLDDLILVMGLRA